jgi:type III secretion protein J
MTPHTKALAWLALALTALLAGCRSDLYSEIAEEDANEIIDTLYAAGIDSRKEPAGEKTFRVQVEGDQLPAALRATRERGLPRQRFADLGTLFKKEGLVSTPSEERVRFIYGIAQELSSTISSIDGVISARVHPVIPSNDPMADKIKPSSASVFIKYSPNANVQSQGPTIKNLVVHAIEGLNADNVTLHFVAADPPARKAAAVAALPAWFDWVLGVAVGVFAIIVAALGFVLWRYRQLAGVVHEDHVAPAVATESERRVPWLQSLWRGWAAWGGKARRGASWLPRVREVVRDVPNAQRFGGTAGPTTVEPGTAGRVR